MATQETYNNDTFISVIREAIKNNIERIINEEAEAAKVRVGERIAGAMDGWVLSLLKRYDVRQLEDRLVIEVKKP